ncbi:MAG TPA: DUF1365 domain-containing protein [Nocardioidaceae bacterium]|nr:DUF1365 domain-containing protein [Nocardioidaceae bacterium]
MSAVAESPASVRALVHHRRLQPVPYEFSHRTTMWLVDAADPNAAFSRWVRPFASIRSDDHFGADDDRSLVAKVRSFIEAQELPWTGHRVLVLANARSLGYVFDPLTTYFCFDDAGELEGVLAEVHNTYGDRHCYPLQVDRSSPTRSTTEKTFYVSPFFAVEGRYDIKTRLTEDEVAVAITLTSPDDRRLFTAAVHGDLEPATRGRTLRRVAGNPLPSQRVAALIRWHGIRLWLRKLPVVPRPAHQAPKGFS